MYKLHMVSWRNRGWLWMVSITRASMERC